MEEPGVTYLRAATPYFCYSSAPCGALEGAPITGVRGMRAMQGPRGFHLRSQRRGVRNFISRISVRNFLRIDA